jgi:hypothetical protein
MQARRSLQLLSSLPTCLPTLHRAAPPPPGLAAPHMTSTTAFIRARRASMAFFLSAPSGSSSARISCFALAWTALRFGSRLGLPLPCCCCCCCSSARISAAGTRRSLGGGGGCRARWSSGGAGPAPLPAGTTERTASLLVAADLHAPRRSTANAPPPLPPLPPPLPRLVAARSALSLLVARTCGLSGES